VLYCQSWFRPVSILAIFGSQAPPAEESSERTPEKRPEIQKTAGKSGGFFLTRETLILQGATP
jgi:hypothetical protein